MLRIGELSKRSGVSPELLRAWERRYGLLHPERSPGGLRLYSVEDLERVRVMRRHLAEGLAAAEAAALASGAMATRQPAHTADAARAELAAALAEFDEARAQDVLDDVLATLTVETLLVDVVLPYLHELGEQWARGEASVAQEHFASNVLHGRMLGLARGWARGRGPLALLACLPGERHELGLIAYGLALRARGWRIGYFGADTPLETLARAARALTPELVVLSAVTAERLRPVEAELFPIAQERRVALGGAAAGEVDAETLGLLALTRDPVSEAARVTEGA